MLQEGVLVAAGVGVSAAWRPQDSCPLPTALSHSFHTWSVNHGAESLLASELVSSEAGGVPCSECQVSLCLLPGASTHMDRGEGPGHPQQERSGRAAWKKRH